MALAHIQGHRVVWFLYILLLYICMMLVRFYVLFILVCGGEKREREHNLTGTGPRVLCLISVVNLVKPEQFVVDF